MSSGWGNGGIYDPANPPGAPLLSKSILGGRVGKEKEPCDCEALRQRIVELEAVIEILKQ